MSITFSRSLSSLAADGNRRPLLLLLGVVLVLGAWGAWFVLADVGLYEVTPAARLEVVRQVHPVQALVAGRVVRTRVVLGRKVSAGELLVQLDDTEPRLTLAEERARLAAVQARLKTQRELIAAEQRALGEGEKAARAALREARAKERQEAVMARYARDKAHRLADLLQGGHVAQLDTLKASAEAKLGEATLDTLKASAVRIQQDQRTVLSDRRAKLVQLRHEEAQLQGEAARLQATVKRLEHTVARHRVTAPVAGTLGDLGALHQVGAYLAAGSVLCNVVPKGELRAVGRFPAALAMGRIRPGQPARMRLSGFPWVQYGTLAARVERVAGEPSDGMVRVELTLAPEQNRRIPLQHGLPGSLEVEVERVSPAVLVLRTAGMIVGGGGR